MDWEKTYAAEVSRVRDLLERQLGVRDIEFDEDLVPDTLRDLIPLARVFGIGFAHVRAAAIDLMPREFLLWARDCVCAKRHTVVNWVVAGPWNGARRAILALDDAFGDLNDDDEPDPEVAAAIALELKRLRVN
jgi:hypothetical protein